MNENKKLISGFTLLEVMVVVAIIGIMAGIAVPSFIGWLPDYRLKSVSRELFSEFQLARLQAVKDNKDWAIVFDVANKQYLICSDKGADDSWSATDDNTIYKTIPFTDDRNGVRFGHGCATSPAATSSTTFPVDNVSYNYNVVAFKSNGTCSNGYVYLDNNQNSSTYAVGSVVSGSIVLRRWNGSDWK